jgi:hypothetical protein
VRFLPPQAGTARLALTKILEQLREEGYNVEGFTNKQVSNFWTAQRRDEKRKETGEKRTYNKVQDSFWKQRRWLFGWALKLSERWGNNIIVLMQNPSGVTTSGSAKVGFEQWRWEVAGPTLKYE